AVLDLAGRARAAARLDGGGQERHQGRVPRLHQTGVDRHAAGELAQTGRVGRMTYRDDLEAALERADDLERDLERERGAHARDEEKIKELERQLAEARKQAAHAKTKKEQPAKASPQDEAAKSGKRNMLWMVAGASALIVLLMYLGFTMYGGAPRKPAVPSSLPLMPRPPSASPSDPDQFDVTAGYFTALDLARKELPDAELTMLKAEFVDERGMAHLNYDGRARYNFRSPSRAAAPEPPANVPLGVPHPS